MRVIHRIPIFVTLASLACSTPRQNPPPSATTDATANHRPGDDRAITGDAAPSQPGRAVPGAATLAVPMDEYFPLRQGASWIYRGRAAWVEGEGEKAVDKNGEVSIQMEVLEVIEKKHVTAYVVQGFPGDLVGYAGGPIKPTRRVIIRVGTGSYYLGNDEALACIKGDVDELAKVEPEELFLDVPLAVGKVFGMIESLARPDGLYGWLVLEEKQTPASDIRGIADGTPLHTFTLKFETSPDGTLVDFVPGVGITSYSFLHKGTTDELDVTLVEYHPGR